MNINCLYIVFMFITHKFKHNLLFKLVKQLNTNTCRAEMTAFKAGVNFVMKSREQTCDLQ